jgi:hypothetical protein
MKLYRRILLLTLTLLLLVSATGISVGLHLCGGKIHDLSFFGQAADCPMEQKQQALPPCHTSKESLNAEKQCCEQHQLVLSGVDDLAAHKTQLLTKAPDLHLLAAVQAFIRQLLAPVAAPNPAYALYASPPIARDIPVLGQSFLL